MSRVLSPLPPLDRWQRRALVAVLLVATLLRLGWAVLVAEEPAWDPLPRDPGWYLHLGENVADGKGYAYVTVLGDGELGYQATGYYPPGYPLLLGGLFTVVNLLPGELSLYGAALGLNILLSVATVALVFSLGRRLFNPQVGLAAAAVMAIWPNLVFHAGVVLTETLALFLLAALWLVVLASPQVVRGPGWRRLVAAGALLGALGLVRPTSLVMAPLFLLLWWPWGLRTTVRRTALVAVGALVVILPWTVRNLAQLGEPVLISTNTGDNLCIGHGPGATGGYNETSYCFEGVAEHNPSVETRAEFDVRRQSETIDRAVQAIGDDPLRVVTGIPARLRHTMTGDADAVEAATDYRRYGRFTLGLPGGRELSVRAQPVREAAHGGYVVIWSLATVGAVMATMSAVRARRGERASTTAAGAATAAAPPADWRTVFFLATAAVQMVPPLLTFGDERFKVPTYPAVAILAAVAVVALVTRLRSPASDPEGDDDPSPVPRDAAVAGQ